MLGQVISGYVRFGRVTSGYVRLRKYVLVSSA